MTFSGDLRGISLADIFQNIAGNMISGTLRVHWRNTERFVRFESGKVAGFSLGPSKGLPILDHLVKRGYVDSKQLHNLLARRKRSRKSPGRLLVEAKLMTAEQLSDAISELVAEHVFDLIMQRDATFAFHEGDPPPKVFGPDQSAFPVRIEAGPLLVEGARRADESEQIRKVVGSDRDLFVLLEGWEQFELYPLTAEIAQALDGRTDVLQLLHQFSASRFDIVKAVSSLVTMGAARPCTVQEIEANARQALEEGETEDGVRLLRQALELERSNTELRHELADLLEELGHINDAASQHAMLGFQAAREGDEQAALSHYRRATSLNPSDPELYEQMVDLLRANGDRAALASSMLELSALWLSMGLADRAQKMLTEALASGKLQHHVALNERLAEIEARLGNVDTSAQIFERLADHVLTDDEAQAVYYLRQARKHSPDDGRLEKRLRDIETGQRARRLRRRRQIVVATAAATVMLAVATAGVAELTASRRVVQALDDGLTSLSTRDVVSTISELQTVRESWGWTPSGHRAEALLSRLVQMQVEYARQLAAEGESQRAFELLGQLQPVAHGNAVDSAADEVRRQIDLEKSAADYLGLVAEGSINAGELDEATKQLSDPRLLPFHLRRLPALRQTRARDLTLQALLRIDSPRSLPVVARLFITEEDPKARKLLREILERAPVYRKQGKESVWIHVYPEFEAASVDPAQSSMARAVLRLLRGDG